MMERLSPAVELKLAGEPTSTGTFAGWAATFNGPIDSYGDVIANGAFRSALLTHKEAKTAPALLWSHDQNEVIGVWLEVREDPKGLYVEGKLTLATQRGAEAHALMKDGALGLSIGYRVAPGGASFSEQGRRRTIKNIDWLPEISAVAIPANPAARITAVKSIADIRHFEAVLRDEHGFSVREAKRLASGGWPALKERDVRSEEAAELARHICRRAADLTTIAKDLKHG